MAARTGHTPLHRRRRVRAERTQALFTLVGLGLGLVMPRVSGGPQIASGQVTTMLLTLGFGVLGVVAVIFSLLFLVVQWAHSNFSPRLTLFREAPIVWRTFAMAISVTVFSITAALAIGTRPHVSFAVPALAGIMLLTMLAMLRRLQLQAFASIQLAPVLLAITQRGRAILASLYPGPAGPVPMSDVELPAPVATVAWPGHLSVLQQIDMDELVTAAEQCGAVIVLHVTPGEVLRHGAPLADIRGAPLPAGAVLDCMVTGTERTLEQDPLQAFRLLADIVMRALSPAVNDPATAVQGLHCLEDLLEGLQGVPRGPLYVSDHEGEPRVVLTLPDWGDFLRTGLDGIIAAAMGSPIVLMRLRALLARLHPHVQDRNQTAVTARLTWVEEELATRFPVLWNETAAG
ncbi:DUF2254 family protein [Streptomyces sp. RKAG293]|uniref:DUF2254 family protein n=1 Tax=Streptomyces sp. RKAG293 TaxID=2893403 RepID=UPI002033F55F|nr:DUF2254 family protein [Streptomyces sp. RKAG293]MCM2416712.1 DUF2254 domain-containing protein [Streptomyces sp. RKAG293]